MNAIAVSDAPAVDTFGGLRRETETPEQALRRLERKSNYVKVIGSDEGQRLLAAATAQVAAARNGVAPRWAAVAPDDRIGELKCNGGNHVPGHTAGCPRYTAPAAAAPAETAAPAPSRASSVAAQLMDVPLDLVDIGENVRTDPGDLGGLAASIEDIGVQQPIVAVGPGADGRYRAVNGQRRILATRLAKRSTIPAVVYAASDLDLPGNRRSLAQLAENLQRKEMNKVEEALALRAVLDGEKGLTQAALAKKIGISEPTLSSTLALLRAPAEVQELVRSETLSIGHAKALAGLPAADQVRLAKSAAENGVSAHALEDTAKWERSRQTDRDAGKKLTDAAAKRGLAALEKAGTPKDVRLFVTTDHWQIQDADVRKVIRAAGYKVDDGWASGGERWLNCDCTALQLRIRDGEGSTIATVCTSDAHLRAWEKEHNAKATEKQAAAEAERKVLAKAVRAAMPADLHPTLGRLILKVLDGYYGKTWTEYSKLPDDKVPAAIADKLTSEQALRGSSYNGDSKALPIKTLIKEFGGEVANTPALPSGRKPGKAKAATS